MNLGHILKGNAGLKPTAKSVDACAMVNGKLTNAKICDDMLEGEKPSAEVTKYMIDQAITMGFTPDEANRYWGG